MHSQNSLERSRPLGLPSSLSDGAYVSRCALAGRSAFIYAVRERSVGALYIGQTCNPNGALGRLAQHLSWDTDSNTFRRRVLAVFRIDEIELENVELIAIPLPDESRYQSAARDYREAIESLVHDHVLEALTLAGGSAGLVLVSRAYRHPYRKDEEVISLARRVGNEICGWITNMDTTSHG